MELSSHDYDVLIFTQSWPQSKCFEWEEESTSHKCNLPTDEEWIIHGIWPSKDHTMGPFYCNRSLHFDINALNPLKDELHTKWMDVHKGVTPGDFWRHEWEKHGTCAVSIESVNSEIKYFKKGLDLLDEYDMKAVLAKANILPGQQYSVQQLLDAVKEILDTNGFVECIQNKVRTRKSEKEIRKSFRI